MNDYPSSTLQLHNEHQTLGKCPCSECFIRCWQYDVPFECPYCSKPTDTYALSIIGCSMGQECGEYWASACCEESARVIRRHYEVTTGGNTIFDIYKSPVS